MKRYDWSNKNGHFYFVPIYFNPINNEIRGRNLFLDIILSAMIKIHNFLIFVMSFFVDDNFQFSYPLKIEAEKDE